MHEDDPEKVQECIDNAVNGLLFLQQYTSFDTRNPIWNLGLMSNPIQDPSLPQVTLSQLISSGGGQELVQIAPPAEPAPHQLGTQTADNMLLEDSSHVGEEDVPQAPSSGPEISFVDLMQRPAEGTGRLRGSTELESAAASIRAAMSKPRRQQRRKKVAPSKRES